MSCVQKKKNCYLWPKIARERETIKKKILFQQKNISCYTSELNREASQIIITLYEVAAKKIYREIVTFLHSFNKLIKFLMIWLILSSSKIFFYFFVLLFSVPSPNTILYYYCCFFSRFDVFIFIFLFLVCWRRMNYHRVSNHKKKITSGKSANVYSS